MTYEKDLFPDKYALDEEWEKQAKLYYDYSKSQADAEYTRDKLKDLVETEKAILEKKIRNNPEEFGIIGKPTESAIKAEIVINDKIIEANNKYFEASKEAKVLLAVVKSFDHKKKALEKLCELFLNNYYSRPNIPKSLEKQSLETVKTEQNENLKISMRRRKK